MSNCKHLKDITKIFQKVNKLTDGYAIKGCCGGGCYTITNIRYCPFCGVRL